MTYFSRFEGNACCAKVVDILGLQTGVAQLKLLEAHAC